MERAVTQNGRLLQGPIKIFAGEMEIMTQAMKLTGMLCRQKCIRLLVHRGWGDWEGAKVQCLCMEFTCVLDENSKILVNLNL